MKQLYLPKNPLCSTPGLRDLWREKMFSKVFLFWFCWFYKLVPTVSLRTEKRYFYWSMNNTCCTDDYYYAATNIK